MQQPLGLACLVTAFRSPAGHMSGLTFRTGVAYTLNGEEAAMYKQETGVVKRMSVKLGKDKFWVQEMPGFYANGRDYAVMMNRRQLSHVRYKTAHEAAAWLIAYLTRELNSEKIFPREDCQI